MDEKHKKQDDYKDKMDETRGGELFQKPRRWEKPEKFL